MPWNEASAAETVLGLSRMFMVKTTSSAPKRLPSWKVTPGCRLNVQTVASALGDQLLASTGRRLRSLLTQTRYSATCWAMAIEPVSYMVVGIDRDGRRGHGELERAARLGRGRRRGRARARRRAAAGGQDLADERGRQADDAGAHEKLAPRHATTEHLVEQVIRVLALERSVVNHVVPQSRRRSSAHSRFASVRGTRCGRSRARLARCWAAGMMRARRVFVQARRGRCR